MLVENENLHTNLTELVLRTLYSVQCTRDIPINLARFVDFLCFSEIHLFMCAMHFCY